MQLHTTPTRALSIDGDFASVATERRDMPLHPAKGFNLVEKPGVKVTEGRVGTEFRVREETEGAETIVDRNDDNVGGLVNPVLEGPECRISEDISQRGLQSVECGHR